MWIDRVYRMHRLMGAVNNKTVTANTVANVHYSTHNAIAFTFYHQRIMDKIAEENSMGKINRMSRYFLSSKFYRKSLNSAICFPLRFNSLNFGKFNLFS